MYLIKSLSEFFNNGSIFQKQKRRYILLDNLRICIGFLYYHFYKNSVEVGWYLKDLAQQWSDQLPWELVEQIYFKSNVFKNPEERPNRHGRASQSRVSNTWRKSSERSRLGAKYLGLYGTADNKKTMSSAQEARCRVRIQDPAGPFMGSSRGGAPCSKQRRPPGLRKSDTPPRGTSGCALPYSSIFRPVPIPLNDRQPPPRGRPLARCVGIVNAVIPLSSITSIGIAPFDGGLKARGR